MALNKQALDISFAQGLDTKTDPFRVQPGKFLSLVNSIFDKNGMLQKRNGFSPLPSLPDSTSKFVTTFNGNLTAIGTKLEALSTNIAGGKWVNKGSIMPVSVDTLPLIKSNTTQSQCDSVVSSTGFVCTVYTDSIPSQTGVAAVTYKYVIAAKETGQNIIAPTLIPSQGGGTVTGSPRVFIIGNFFFIVYTNVITTTPHLDYVAISTVDPTVTPLTGELVSAYTASTTLSWDGVVYSDTLYLAYNNVVGGQNISVKTVSNNLVISAAKVFAGEICTMLSMTVDYTTPTNPIIWAAYYDLAGTAGKAFAIFPDLSTARAPIAIIASGTYLNITCTAKSGVLTFFAEKSNNYSYDSTIPSHFIDMNTMTLSGTLGTSAVLKRSVGIASKAFLYNNLSYLLVAYQSSYQPSYFLISNEGNVIAKLAYSNGGGYLTVGLPSALIVDDTVQIGYLLKDFIQAANKTQGSTEAPVYTQTGINLVSIDLDIQKITASEIGNNLNISGGFVTAYDGYSPVEQGFFIWPDNVELTNPTNPTPTGDTGTGLFTISNVSSTANISIGMNVTGTDIPASTKVVSIVGTTITLDKASAGTHVTSTFTFTGNVTNQLYYYQATYEWTDNQGNLFRSAPSIPVGITTSASSLSVQVNVPTLRLTYKTANPVKIVIYRWSTAQQNYYQVTSIANPVLNSTTTDSVTYIDSKSDSQILGNNLIYTTGGVLENTSPPATDNLSLFNNRLWLIDAEDRNKLQYSKQVIESTPVEISDLLTIYVSPTTAAQQSTGPITAHAPMDDKHIIFKRNALGYINGIGPDNAGQNNQYSDFTLINSVVGCSNQNSIVLIPDGLIFESSKGLWIVRRDLNTNYIGAPVEELTRGASVLSAVNVPDTNQVRFTMSSGITIMYDYYYQQWGSFTGVPALSSTIYESLHTYINTLGQVFQESVGEYLDNTNPVLMSFTTSWISLAGLQGFERFYQMFLLGTYITPFKLNCQFAYNYNPSIRQNEIVTPNAPSAAWGGDALWGSSTPWGGPSNVFEARVFPTIQKCESFQIAVNEIYDPQYGISAGAGLTISGLNLVVGMKKGYRTQSSARSF